MSAGSVGGKMSRCCPGRTLFGLEGLRDDLGSEVSGAPASTGSGVALSKIVSRSSSLSGSVDFEEAIAAKETYEEGFSMLSPRTKLMMA